MIEREPDIQVIAHNPDTDMDIEIEVVTRNITLTEHPSMPGVSYDSEREAIGFVRVTKQNNNAQYTVHTPDKTEIGQVNQRDAAWYSTQWPAIEFCSLDEAVQHTFAAHSPEFRGTKGPVQLVGEKMDILLRSQAGGNRDALAVLLEMLTEACDEISRNEEGTPLWQPIADKLWDAKTGFETACLKISCSSTTTPQTISDTQTDSEPASNDSD